MSIIGRAIARLTKQCGGQVLLELPDDLPPHVVSRFVAAANEEAGSPDFALFANDQRADADCIKPTVSFRELAAHRQGNHVAIAYASDNRGMHTYTSVYPNLLAPGFPDEVEEMLLNGVGSLQALSVQAARVIGDRHHLSPPHVEDLEKAIPHVARFLADAYLFSGNGQTGLAADWWFHADEWLVSLDEWLTSNPFNDVEKFVFGSAGVPFRAGTEDGLTAKELVKAFTERWNGPESVRVELARLSGDASGCKAAEILELLPWETAMPSVAIRTDSVLSRVSMIGSLDTASRSRRTEGWAHLDAVAFKNAFVEAKNKLNLRIGGVDVPRPWSGGAATITVGEDASDGEWLDLGLVELVVPWRSDVIPQSDDLTAGMEAEFEIQGGRGSSVRFEAGSVDSSPKGLKLSGRLKLQPPSKAPHAAAIVVLSSPSASSLVVDKCSMELTLVRGDEVAIFLRRSEGVGSGRKSVLGPYLWREESEIPTSIPLISPGKYFVAVAAGVSSTAFGAPILCGDDVVSSPWPCDLLQGKYVLGEMQLDQGTEVGALRPMFSIEASQDGVAPHLSPVISAAFSQQPDIDRQVPEGALAWLDAIVTKHLSELTTGSLLGAVLVASGSEYGDLRKHATGCYIEASLIGQIGVLTPGIPSSNLSANSHYVALVESYRGLGITERIETLQQGRDVASLTISRLSLEFISQEQIDGLLGAYSALIRESGAFASPADQFWARHPFSAIVFPNAIGSQAATAVLLSPLHPLRLAWLWMVQKGLRAAADDGLSPEIALGLLDPSAYPAHVSIPNPLGAASHYVPLPLEAGPESLYLGWQALVQFLNGEASVPEAVSGYTFPVEGLSSISTGAVSSALDDFLRVSPHVQALRVGLESTLAARRSRALDSGILEKIKTLARRSSGLESIGGVSILDSTNRRGSVPSFQDLGDSLKAARPGFNVSWTSRSPGNQEPVHVSFLEGTAARVGLAEGVGVRHGWIPAIPLRRFPRRTRPAPGIADLDYSLPSPSAEYSNFQNALSLYEELTNGGAAVIRVIPNLAALPSRPAWLVAGDFGADPQAIADAASAGNGHDYMLWDWRPIATVNAKAGLATGKVQPYFVLATIPRALSAAIANRITKLRPALGPEEIVQRTRRLVSVLANHAIGLNTLLAIGHHQATGALGFYFAIESINRWAANSAGDEIRMILPVDAVDPYLRTLPGAGGESRRRADLIAVSIKRNHAGLAQVKLVPIEIKHYGLSVQGPTNFPASGDSSLREHLAQLGAYQRQLLALASNYMEGASSAASIFGSRLAIVLEAGMQLCAPARSAQAASLLSDIASGKGSIEVGKGALLWFQVGAVDADGSHAAWLDVPGTDEDRHVEVRIDPAAFDECYWHDKDGEPHRVISEALLAAVDVQAASGIESAGIDNMTTSTRGKVDSSDGLSRPDLRPAGSSQIEKKEAHEGASVVAHLSTGKHLDARELERRYTQILGCLEEFNVKARRPKLDELPYIEGPSFVEYAIEPAYGVSVSKIESQLDNLKLRLKLPSDAQIGCTTHLGNVLLSIPKHDADRYFVDAEEMWSRWKRPNDGFRVPLGEDTRGNVVDLDFSSSNSPHVLLAGTTGSGKSEALLTLLHGAIRYYDKSELRLALIDPKRTELVSLDQTPHKLGDIGFSAEEAIALLASAVEEMEHRYEEFRISKVRDIQEYQQRIGTMPRLLMVLDEYADLTSEEDDRKEIEKYLKRLAQKARAAGIHLIISTQKPVVSVVNTVVKGNLPGRIALRVSTAAESKVILDEGGAEQLTGKGDGLIKAGAKKIRLQFARFSGGG